MKNYLEAFFGVLKQSYCNIFFLLEGILSLHVKFPF